MKGLYLQKPYTFSKHPQVHIPEQASLGDEETVLVLGLINAILRELLGAAQRGWLRSWPCVQEDSHPQPLSPDTRMAYNYPECDVLLPTHLADAKFL